jgi:hypothetical protein
MAETMVAVKEASTVEETMVAVEEASTAAAMAMVKVVAKAEVR